MNKFKMLALALPFALLAGCASTGNQAAGGAASAQAAAPADDAAITAKVKAALAADAETAPLKVDVATSEGVVRLKGEVKTIVLRRKAEAVAKGVQGVKSVDNQLVITG
ncbi:BON domain-containing protein [Noviherbaspirillum humi]|uniref:BON domain-containing protein n=1 Tax=Noviherbaspirillum humi TaxID=1688639 RepID=A0A239F8S1_9BURK|nr:BON domain-containing protein [Noviherbaspirillum humi]SNS53141.1 BON domain-containing protein [Noviherbaspirillum humi]